MAITRLRNYDHASHHVTKYMLGGMQYVMARRVVKRLAISNASDHMPEVGERVIVVSGDWENQLGMGTLIGYATVHMLIQGALGGPNGMMYTMEDPEQKPSDEEVERYNICEVVTFDNIPKIQLDSGEIVYGCHVWWAPADGFENDGQKFRVVWVDGNNDKKLDEVVNTRAEALELARDIDGNSAGKYDSVYVYDGTNNAIFIDGTEYEK